MKEITEDILYKKFHHLRYKCPPDITDLVFLEIEKDYIGRYNYLAELKSKESVNKSVEKYIKSYWKLKKIGVCNTPKCKLLTSYTKHSN